LNKLKILVVVLVAVLVVESAEIAVLYNQTILHGSAVKELAYDHIVSYSATYDQFNQPISNDTEFKLNTPYIGSWEMNIHSSLVPPAINSAKSEAQISLAPEYPSENLSIPTIIVQMRGDGLLRIEYFAQNWNNSYGLVLYNSTSPTWLGGQNITLRFLIFGPPSAVNPQLAPRPNGNITILVGNAIVLADYPIAWASLASMYIYGLHGSAFTSGAVSITVANVEVKS